MDKFLNKELTIRTGIGGIDGSGCLYIGTLISYDDDFVCLETKKEMIYIARKFILGISYRK